jgi:hypothetical protein
MSIGFLERSCHVVVALVQETLEAQRASEELASRALSPQSVDGGAKENTNLIVLL